MRDYKKDVPHWDAPEELKKPEIDYEKLSSYQEFSLFPKEVMEKLSRSANIVAIAEKIVDEYEKALPQEWINKPLAYAIYQVWKEVDEIEVGRHGGVRPMSKTEKHSEWIDHCYDCIHYKQSGKTKRGKCGLKGNNDIRYGSTRSCRYFVRRNKENTPGFERWDEL